jgi:hypothetical protein
MRRQGAAQIRRHGSMDTVLGFVKRAHPLGLPSQHQIGLIRVHEEPGGWMGRPRQVQQMKTVVRLQPEVRDDPLIRLGDYRRASAAKVAMRMNYGAFADGVAQACEKRGVWFDQKHPG